MSRMKTPTLYLRWLDREEPVWAGMQVVNPLGTTTVHTTVRVLQQFWQHDDGDCTVGFLFGGIRGSWCDVPVAREG